MANNDGNDDRLTKNEFAELIQHLSLQEILAIEYRIAANWNKLFLRKNATAIISCNICIQYANSFKSLLEHVNGRKHKLQMEGVKQLYHSDYTYPKDYECEVTENPSTKNLESNSESCEPKIVLNTLNQPAVVSSKSKKKNEEFYINSGVNLESSTTADNTDTNVPNVDEFIKDNASNDIEKQEPIISKEKVLELEESSQTMTEVNKITLNSETTLKEEVTKKFAEKRISNDSYVEEKSNTKKAKIVINPAAALSLMQSAKKKKEEKNKNDEKPHYQTDKIIIPTIHKKNDKDKLSSVTVLTSQPRSNDQPQFSVKTYSSKPNNSNVHGILGVEYVIKILRHRNDTSPRFECGLCELVFDGFTMQRHLEGYNHRLKYCEKHFPTAIRHYRQYMHNVRESELFKVMAAVLVKLAVAIEQHHGRNLPYECYERDFSLNRHEILAKAFSCRHASEQFGPTFTHVVDSKEIDELINNRHKYMPPPFSRSAIFDIKPGSTSKSNDKYQTLKNEDRESNLRDRHRNRTTALSQGTSFKSYMSSGLNEEVYSPLSIYNQADNMNVVHRVDDETYNLMVDDFLKGTLKGMSGNKVRDNCKHSLSPCSATTEKRKSLSPLRQNDIWQAYRHMVDQELYKLDEGFKQYRKDPETHPSYNDEWQKFWKRRKDELVSAGLDHRKYNYQPEWVRFVKIRIEELYGQDVENLKIKCRERLCLPLDNHNISDERYHVKAPKINMLQSTQATNTKTTFSLLNASAVLPDSNKITPQVVSVLRLMTALEDNLGSLGPKIIDLLSKALQIEKTNPSQVNEIILNDDNCSLIETAKEKFKGLVLTNLFEGSKKKVLNQVIIDAEALLQHAYKYKQLLTSQRSLVHTSTIQTHNKLSFSHESVSSKFLDAINKNQQKNYLSNKKDQPLSSTDLLTHVDKKELASKLASSLVAQGKTDFDPQQLQQLIAVYKLIEKKKRENVGIVSLNKEDNFLAGSSSSSKKTLSDTLSDLLKTTPSTFTTSEILNETQRNRQFSSTNFSKLAIDNCLPSNSLKSVSQNCSDNFFSNTAQSRVNAHSVSGEGANQFEHRSNYNMNYKNNHPLNQQNLNMYNNQYQNNNRMEQNWGWYSNMESNHNYDKGGSNTNNNNF